MEQKPSVSFCLNPAWVGIGLTLISAISTALLFLVGTSFQTGRELAEIHASIRNLEQKVNAQNQLQDYKLAEFEKRLDSQLPTPTRKIN